MMHTGPYIYGDSKRYAVIIVDQYSRYTHTLTTMQKSNTSSMTGHVPNNSNITVQQARSPLINEPNVQVLVT